jgi:hypothetical protein
MEVVEVDPVGPQPRQALVDRPAQRLRPPVDHAFAVHAGHPAFRREEIVVAAMRDALADQRLVLAESVERGGIEMVVAQVQRRVEQARALIGRRRYAIGMAQRHAAQPHGADGGRSQTTFHACTSSGQ